MQILNCENVSKIYGSGENQVTALNKINLTIEKGEFVALVGPPAQENLPSSTCWEAWTRLRRAKSP